MAVRPRSNMARTAAAAAKSQAAIRTYFGTVRSVGNGTVDVTLDGHSGLKQGVRLLGGVPRAGDRIQVNEVDGIFYATGPATEASSARGAGLVVQGGSATTGGGSAYPLAHAGSHSTTGADPLAPSAIGAATPAQIATAISDHLAEPDPHAQYLLESAAAETAQDAVGAALYNTGHDVLLAYDDANNRISADVDKDDAFTWTAAHIFNSAIVTANAGLTVSGAAITANAGIVVAAGQSLTTPAIIATAGLSIAPTNDITLNPGGKYTNPLANYDINLGAINKKYLTLHAAELWVETLVAQNTMATFGGRILVGPTTVLTSDLASGDTTIYVKHNNLANGDRVYMEANGSVEFMAVTSAASGAGPYSYTVTRNLDGSGANQWYAGDAVFNTGTTNDGWIDLYSIRGVKSATQYGPAIVGNVRTGTTYNQWAEHWAIGNLNGIYGYGADTYGLAAGKFADSSAWISVDATNGLRINYGATTPVVLGQWDMSGNIIVGQVAASKNNILISSGAISIRNNTTVLAQWDASGNILIGQASGTNANTYITAGKLSLRSGTVEKITLDASGNASIEGVLTIGTGGEIRQGTGTLGSNFTGLRAWRDSDIGRIGGYNNNVLQWSGSTDGKLRAGASTWLDAAGLGMDYTIGSDASAVKWYNAGTVFASIVGKAISGARGLFHTAQIHQFFNGTDFDLEIGVGYAKVSGNLYFGAGTFLGTQQALTSDGIGGSGRWQSNGAIFLQNGTGKNQMGGAARESGSTFWVNDTGELFPVGDGRGLFARAINRVTHSVTDHFRSGSIPTGYAWQASPFDGTPTTLFYSYASDYLAAIGKNAGVKMFLSKAITNSAAAWQNKVVSARIRTGVTTEIGTRVDDGTDDNFAELYVAPLGDGTQILRMRYRAGGGAVTTADSGVIIPADTYIVVMLSCYWNGSQYQFIGYLIGEDGGAVNISGFGSGVVTWCPAAGRTGIVVKGIGSYGLVDWFYSTFT